MKNIALLFVLLSIYFCSHAQKLPNVQQISLRAPAKVKIDGKLTEWGDMLSAYNKNTQVYYTISNDLNNLYLTVNVTDVRTIKKILAAGLTFSINKQNKKKDSTTMAFTFPYYRKGEKLMTISGELTAGDKTKLKLDSFANVYSMQIPTIFKTVGVRGIKHIGDDIISIYNEENIKVAALFNMDMAYNFELAIPLKLLELKPVEKSKFNYNVQLNAQTSVNGFAIKAVESRSEILYYEDNKGERYIVVGPGGRTSPDSDAYYNTDFWGEYTLAD